MMPSFGGVGGGKLTVIKAGPGFHEEKSYNIAADGHLTQTGDVKDSASKSSIRRFVITEKAPTRAFS